MPKDINAQAETDPSKKNDTASTDGKGPAPNTGDAAVIEKEQKATADIPQNEQGNGGIVDTEKGPTGLDKDASEIESEKIVNQETGSLTKEAVDGDLNQDREFLGDDKDGHFEELDEEERAYRARRADPLDSDDLVQHPGQVFRNKTDQKVAYAPPGTYNAAMAGVQQDASGHFESVGKINSEKSGTRI